MLALLVALIALLAAAPVAQAQVQVHVDIGFHLPAPPRLVVVPQVPAVQYVPQPAAPGTSSSTTASTGRSPRAAGT